ncbi:hypothetical protein, partial [Photorhabdus viridis]|uniref:hypothetical protein n=1 Tax=Photorhabdus viridis TaxID=3163327 RepID=UPI0033078852
LRSESVNARLIFKALRAFRLISPPALGEGLRRFSLKLSKLIDKACLQPYRYFLAFNILSPGFARKKVS